MGRAIRRASVLVSLAALWASARAGVAEDCCLLEVSVQDAAALPLVGAQISVFGSSGSHTALTTNRGEARVSLPAPGPWLIEVSLAGYPSLRRQVEVPDGTPLSVTFTLTPPPARRESVTVQDQAPEAVAAATTPTSAAPDQLKALPADPGTLREALPLIPGILRTPEGKLRISGGAEHRSTLLVNSLNVTDPATGSFGATVPIESVETLNFFKSPFLAEYGRFTAGVVAVETRSGGDKWRWEWNDPTPEFRIRSGHLVGIRAFTPRLSWSGPLRPGRLYYSQAFEYRLNKTPVTTLQFPDNEIKRESWNSLAQLDWVASPAHLVTVTLHGVPVKINYVNLGFYNPEPATPNHHGHEFRGSVSDRYHVRGGVLESALAYGETVARTGAQGDAELVMRPNGDHGNYFSRQDRRADRAEWREAFSAAPVSARGPHRLKFGASILRAALNAGFTGRPVVVEDLSGVRLRRIEYANSSPFRLTDWEVSVFGQDTWQPLSVLALDTGLRLDWQKATGTYRLAPRVGLALSPPGDERTRLRAGYGWFFDRVPLNVYAFPSYPRQIVTEFRPDGSLLDGPRYFANVIETVEGSRGPFVFGAERPGNFAPQSRTFNVQIDHEFERWVKVRAAWLHSDSNSLMTVRPGMAGSLDALLMSGDALASYRQFEVIARVSWRKEQELFFSYQRSDSRGHLNEFTTVVGDFPAPIVRPDLIAELPANIPHRFLAWGIVPLRWDLRVAPVVEYRTGFPYSALDARQDYAEPPNARHFPPFFSLDFRVSKDVIYKRKYKVQISFSCFNLTNHWNPDTVRWNVTDPQFGEFLGQHPRRFRLDFDITF